MTDSITLAIIVGKIASGKTTFADVLTLQYGYEKVITATSRDPRPGESDGVAYHFIPADEWVTLSEQGYFLEEVVTPSGDHYGIPTSSFENLSKNTVIILTPPGVVSLVSALGFMSTPNLKIQVVYLDIPVEIRKDRLRAREGILSSKTLSRIVSEETDFFPSDFHRFLDDTSLQVEFIRLVPGLEYPTKRSSSWAR